MSNRDRIFIGGLFLFVILLQAALFKSIIDDLIALENRPPIVYQVDNAGGGLPIGTVTEKKRKDSTFMVAVNGYGWFKVSEDVYDAVLVGEMVPDGVMEKEQGDE